MLLLPRNTEKGVNLTNEIRTYHRGKMPPDPAATFSIFQYQDSPICSAPPIEAAVISSHPAGISSPIFIFSFLSDWFRYVISYTITLPGSTAAPSFPIGETARMPHGSLYSGFRISWIYPRPSLFSGIQLSTSLPSVSF